MPDRTFAKFCGEEVSPATNDLCSETCPQDEQRMNQSLLRTNHCSTGNNNHKTKTAHTTKTTPMVSPWPGHPCLPPIIPLAPSVVGWGMLQWQQSAAPLPHPAPPLALVLGPSLRLRLTPRPPTVGAMRHLWACPCGLPVAPWCLWLAALLPGPMRFAPNAGTAGGGVPTMPAMAKESPFLAEDHPEHARNHFHSLLPCLLCCIAGLSIYNTTNSNKFRANFIDTCYPRGVFYKRLTGMQ